MCLGNRIYKNSNPLGPREKKKVSLIVKVWGPLGCMSRSPPVVDRGPVWPEASECCC